MRITLFVASLTVLASSPLADAALVLPPPPVGQYRLAFVTSEGMPATSPNIADYNQFVDDLANDEQPALAALGTTWTVIGSTVDVSAILNTMTDPGPLGNTGVPIYRLDGIKIADHYDDLWDGDDLDATLSVMETGDPYTGLVWTGTTTSGTQDASNELGGDMPNRGSASSTSGWITTGSADPSLSFPLYAISGVLTAPLCPSRVHFYA